MFCFGKEEDFQGPGSGFSLLRIPEIPEGAEREDVTAVAGSPCIPPSSEQTARLREGRGQDQLLENDPSGVKLPQHPVRAALWLDWAVVVAQCHRGAAALRGSSWVAVGGHGWPGPILPSRPLSEYHGCLAVPAPGQCCHH